MHTPGPWHVDKNATIPRYIYNADGVGIGEIWRGVNGRGGEEDDANARLIAAAPKLLEALEALARTMREQLASLADDGKVNASKTRAAFTQADVAIAGAKGE